MIQAVVAVILTGLFVIFFLAVVGREALRRECCEKGHVWTPVVINHQERLFCARCSSPVR